jgi:hypothetical protein
VGAHPVALAVDPEDDAAVEQPVEHGGGDHRVVEDLLSRRHWSSRPHGPPCGSRSGRRASVPVGRGPGVRRRAIGPNRAPASVESSSPAAAIAFHATEQPRRRVALAPLGRQPPTTSSDACALSVVTAPPLP